MNVIFGDKWHVIDSGDGGLELTVCPDDLIVNPKVKAERLIVKVTDKGEDNVGKKENDADTQSNPCWMFL